MRRARRRLLAAGAGIALIQACRPAAVLARFPALRLPSLDGGGTLADIEGALVVNYWATWCAPCRSEMPSLERLSKRLPPGVRLLGVTVDEDLNLAREWLRKLGITFAIFADPGTRRSRDALGIHTIPETLLVSPERRILERTKGAREWDSDEQLAGILRRLNRAAERR